MFIVKRKRGSSGRSSKSSSQHNQLVESDGSSHNSKSSLTSGSVALKSILRNGGRRSSHSGSRSGEGSGSHDDETPSGGGGSSSGAARTSVRKSVGFKEVHVRQFERIIGDNPSCSSGAPIAIGWAHDGGRTVHVEEYESERRPRKQLPQLVLSRQDREEILVEWGASFHEIVDSIRANVRAKNQRRRTVSSLDRYDRIEEYMESASRRLKRTLLLKKPVRKQAEEMADKSERFSKVTYIDQPTQLPVPQRDMPHQIPHAPESPKLSVAAHREMNFSIPKGTEATLDQNVLNGDLVDKLAVPDVASPELPAPAIEFEFGEDVSEFYDQYVPVRFVGGDEEALQYLQQMRLEGQNPQVQYLPIRYPFDPDDPVMEDLTFDGDETIGYESLTRSEYDDDEMDAPGIRRGMVAVIISEDGQYDAEGDEWDNGFTLQPPPHSNSIISRWQ